MKRIIGLMGQAGVGKDTFADQLVSKYNYAKVALADPLKRFCRETYKFSYDQLWGPSESRNAPDKRYIRMKAGALGSTDVRFLKNKTTEKFDFAGTVFAGMEDLVNKDGFLPAPPRDEYLTPRYALQLLGTEWGRKCYSNTWIDYTLRIAKEIVAEDGESDGGSVYTSAGGLQFAQVGANYRGVVIPDCRFQNEVDAIHAANGIVIQLVRAGKDGNITGGIANHASEQEQKTIKNVDHTINVIEGHDHYWHQVDAFMTKLE